MSLLAIATIPAALFYTSYAISNQPETVSIKEEIPAPRVTIEQMIAGTHRNTVEVYGEVKSSETLSLLGQVSGRVIWKSDNFKVGKRVKKGDLLIRIEDANYQVSLANANKQLAEAHLALLQEQRKYKRAQDDWKRSEIAEKPSPLVLRQPQMEIAQTQYKAAKRSVVFAKQNLTHTKVYAPFDAVITARNVTTASYISEGGTIGELKSVAAAEIKVALSEREWQQLPSSLESLQAQVFSTENNGQYWMGKITDLSLVIEPSTRTRTLTVTVDAPLDNEVPLLFGTFVNIQIEGKAISNSFTLSSSSLTADGFIWYEQDEKLFRHKADTLFHSLKTVGIAKEDLSETLNLVVKPMSHYVEGMRVVPIDIALEKSNAK